VGTAQASGKHEALSILSLFRSIPSSLPPILLSEPCALRSAVPPLRTRRQGGCALLTESTPGQSTHDYPHQRDTPAGVDPAPLRTPLVYCHLHHVGCGASRTMRPRICPKSVRGTWPPRGSQQRDANPHFESKRPRQPCRWPTRALQGPGSRARGMGASPEGWTGQVCAGLYAHPLGAVNRAGGASPATARTQATQQGRRAPRRQEIAGGAVAGNTTLAWCRGRRSGSHVPGRAVAGSARQAHLLARPALVVPARFTATAGSRPSAGVAPGRASGRASRRGCRAGAPRPRCRE